MGDAVDRSGDGSDARTRMDALQRLSHTGGWHWDREADRIVGSDELFRILGLEPQSQALTRDSFLGFVHPDDRTCAHALFERTLESREPFHLEHRIVRPDGVVRFVQTQADAVVDDEGLVTGVFGSAHDVTERRLAEDGLKSRARQQAAVAKLGERSLAGAQLEDMLREATLAVRDTLGVEFSHVLQLETEEDVMVLRAAAGWPIGMVGTVRVPATPGSQAGYTLASTEPVIVSDIHTETRFETAQALKDHGVVSGISVVIPGEDRPWGTMCVHSTRAREFTQDDANFLRAVANLLGATAARLCADAALRRSEEYFRALIEDAPELIAVVDGGLQVRYLSPAYTKLLGHDPDKLLGSSILQQIHPDDASRVYDTFGRLLARPGSTASVEVRVRHGGNGSWRLLQARARNLLERDTVGGIVINAHDITEHRMLQNRFEQAQKMDAVGRLAGGVAHDFNNALTAIGGYARLIFESLAEKDPLRSDVREILSAAEHATGVVRQLLAFSRSQVRQPVPLDLNHVIADFEAMLRRLVGADIELVVEPDPEDPIVCIDRTQVEQVLVNLALNARDAMPGGGSVRLATTTERVDDGEQAGILLPGAYARITVSDNGTGMPADVLEHLFEPFFTTKAPGRGTGLGLSTVYGIVQQNGGHITCESQPGEGSRFTVWLPLADVGIDRDADAPVDGSIDEADDPSSGEVVLVAEDEPAVRDLARRILERRGYRVLEARDGVEALDVADEHGDSIDLLLTDAIMPRLGGRDLARQLAERKPDVRVLFMSGYAETEIANRGLIGPGIAFLEKPFTADALAAAVRSVLDGDRTPAG